MINIKNLHKHFGKLEVLKGIDLEIASGEVVVVIGPSGSGKSTFLRCLNLLEQPTTGTILFVGWNNDWCTTRIQYLIFIRREVRFMNNNFIAVVKNGLQS